MLPRILCVTSEPHLLRGLGSRFAVDRTADGPEALELLRRHPGRYALVLAGVRMPSTRCDVFLAESRRAAPATGRVLLAGWSDTATALRAERDGLASSVVGMPCAPDELLSACDAVLAEDPAATPVVEVAFGDGRRVAPSLAA